MELNLNQKIFLIEQFSRWGINPQKLDIEFDIKITEDELIELNELGYLCNFMKIGSKYKFNLSIKGQETGRELSQKI